MSDDSRDPERAERDHHRSREAHWRVAEAGAENEEAQRLSDAARQSEGQQTTWEDDGGAFDPDR